MTTQETQLRKSIEAALKLRDAMKKTAEQIKQEKEQAEKAKPVAK
jgi:hypothetical protein